MLYLQDRMRVDAEQVVAKQLAIGNWQLACALLQVEQPEVGGGVFVVQGGRFCFCQLLVASCRLFGIADCSRSAGFLLALPGRSCWLRRSFIFRRRVHGKNVLFQFLERAVSQGHSELYDMVTHGRLALLKHLIELC